MEPACSSEFRSRWSILLTFQNSTQNKRPRRGGDLRPGQFGVTLEKANPSISEKISNTNVTLSNGDEGNCELVQNMTSAALEN
jgi:hypothetical protein